MKRALLVIDVQNEYFTGLLPVTYPPNSLHNILRIIEKARENSIPIIVVQHSAPSKDSKTFIKNSHNWQLHPQIDGMKYDHLIEKTFPSSFTGTNLEEILEKHAVDQVVITGYMTQMCCDSTAREAFHRGYHVEFLSDATATLDISNEAGSVSAEELHRAIVVTQAMRFSKVMSSDQWIDLIARDR